MSRDVRPWVDRRELAELSTLRPGLVALHLGLTWILIFSVVGAALYVDTPGAYALVFLCIAILQNALTLWAHEASHYNFSRHKTRNDTFGDLFAAGPVGITIGQYRWHHLPHHLYLNDPEREINPLAWICVRGTHAVREVLASLLGKYGFQALVRYSAIDKRHPPRPRRTVASVAGLLVSNGLILAACILSGHWWAYFVLWLAPTFTLTLLIGNLRTIVEHQASSDVCDLGLVPQPPITRLVDANRVERLIIAPVGLYFHHEHHMFPSVPYHRLPELRDFLQSRGYFESDDFVRGDGYLRTLWRLSRQPGYGIRLLDPSRLRRTEKRGE